MPLSQPATFPPATSFERPVSADSRLLPLAALMLAGSLGAAPQVQAQAQPAATAAPAPAEAERTLRTVTVTDTLEEVKSKETLHATRTRIGKGNQSLRDIPQTVTVMTERLMDDRNLDDFREVLKTTAGVTFQAGETGEEDVRLRGFSLVQAGDVYVDGLRDASLIERDTFNHERIEVLKGSASMLFGKGSTGGVVNQVSKQPFLMTQHEVNTTAGSGQSLRLTGDFNWQTGESAALRLNVMKQKADNWGAKVDKQGFAPTYRWGIGERDEYTVGLYHMESDGRPLYNHPWLIDNGSSVASNNTSGRIVPVLPAKNFYGLASDTLRTTSSFVTLSHKHRLDSDGEFKTVLRHGHYERDLWAHAMAWCNNTASTSGANAAAGWAQRAACASQGPITSLSQVTGDTVLTRTGKGRRGESEISQAQFEYTGGFQGLGRKHELIAGADLVRDIAQRNNSAGGSALYNTSATSTGTANPDAAYTTTVGTPDDGESRADTRSIAMNRFRSYTVGVYAQDSVHLAPQVKAVAGLRMDRFTAIYNDTSGNRFAMAETLFSPRVGLLWQPSETASYYGSYGSSYNTSGDTYQYAINQALTGTNSTLVNTPPEKSRNFEVGGKWDVLNQKAMLGVALFHSEKYNERNTDVDSAANQYLLSGKRHATGMEFNFAGRLTPAWDLFYNHSWIPEAKIDVSSATGNAQREGDRPGLTPRHSASLWSTYRLAPKWRVGAGVNYRGEQSPDQNRNLVASAFTTADAMVEHNLGANMIAKLNVTNLTNKLYADQLYRGFYVPGATRRVELSLKTLF